MTAAAKDVFIDIMKPLQSEKPEEKATEAAKSESVKMEDSKAETTKIESEKMEVVKAESSKTETVKAESLKIETVIKAEATSEGAKSEPTAKVDSSLLSEKAMNGNSSPAKASNEQ